MFALFVHSSESILYTINVIKLVAAQSYYTMQVTTNYKINSYLLIKATAEQAKGLSMKVLPIEIFKKKKKKRRSEGILIFSRTTGNRRTTVLLRIEVINNWSRTSDVYPYPQPYSRTYERV